MQIEAQSGRAKIGEVEALLKKDSIWISVEDIFLATGINYQYKSDHLVFFCPLQIQSAYT